MPRIIALFLSFVLWIAPEFISVYFIMPIGDSQEWDLFHWSYFTYNNRWIFRILFGLVFLYFAVRLWTNTDNKYYKLLIIVFLVGYGASVYMTNFVMKAERIFVQVTNKAFTGKAENKVPLDRLVMGIEREGQVKAYPIQYLAYHHQLVDTIGLEPVIVTYCNVCRTGRVFSSKVNGVNETFRLVGMSKWNAMFEDKSTRTWWQQATGEAIIGPLKGATLDEIYMHQVTLGEWFDQHPESLVLQPDTNFVETYTYFEDYEDGTEEGSLTRYDSVSWKQKSWIVGIEIGGKAIAFDWNDLKDEKLIQHNFEGTALLLLMGAENKSYRVWNRTVGSVELDFIRKDSTRMLTDVQTMSVWAEYGECLEGELKGSRLQGVPASQEYWHSWQDFHPNTIRYVD